MAGPLELGEAMQKFNLDRPRQAKLNGSELDVEKLRISPQFSFSSNPGPDM